jgi:hypothetical protein
MRIQATVGYFAQDSAGSAVRPFCRGAVSGFRNCQCGQNWLESGYPLNCRVVDSACQRVSRRVESDSTVFYLARYAEGLTPLRRFVDSYKDHTAGIPHRFVVIFKGFESTSALEAARAEFSEIAYSELHISDEQFDIGAYLYGAAHVDAAYVCFLNTHTQILAPGWLLHLRAAMSDPSVGIAGAFASFESLYDSLALISKAIWLAGIERVPFDKKLADCYRFVLKVHAPKYLNAERSWRRLLPRRGSKAVEAKWQSHWNTVCGSGGVYEFLPKFPRFPNAHLRSNGFIVDRELLLNCFAHIEPTKKAAYAFESGSNSLSAQIIRRGKRLALVGRNGELYGESRWSMSNTFRLGTQSNLLLADNQTRVFGNLSEDERNTYVMMSWGLKACDRARAYPLGFSF